MIIIVRYDNGNEHSVELNENVYEIGMTVHPCGMLIDTIDDELYYEALNHFALKYCTGWKNGGTLFIHQIYTDEPNLELQRKWAGNLCIIRSWIIEAINSGKKRILIDCQEIVEWLEAGETDNPIRELGLLKSIKHRVKEVIKLPTINL